MGGHGMCGRGVLFECMLLHTLLSGVCYSWPASLLSIDAGFGTGFQKTSRHGGIAWLQQPA